jgi:hypothetical protein
MQERTYSLDELAKGYKGRNFYCESLRKEVNMIYTKDGMEIELDEGKNTKNNIIDGYQVIQDMINGKIKNIRIHTYIFPDMKSIQPHKMRYPLSDTDCHDSRVVLLVSDFVNGCSVCSKSGLGLPMNLSHMNNDDKNKFLDAVKNVSVTFYGE